MELDIYKIDGTPSGEKIKLPKEIFGIEPNQHAIYLSAVAEEGKNPGARKAAVLPGPDPPDLLCGKGVDVFSDLHRECIINR